MQKRYSKRNASPSCTLPEVRHEACAEDTATNWQDSTVPDPYIFVAVKCEVEESTEERVDTEAAVRLDHCYVTPDYEDGRVVRSNVQAGKEEPAERTAIKLEQLDSTYDSDWTSTAVPRTRVQGEPEIKFESVDLPEIYLCNNYQQVWPPYKEDDRMAGEPEQTDDPRLARKLSDVLKSDKALRILTGIPNYRVFNEIVARTRVYSPRFAKTPGLRLTLEDRIIMTFAKLKQGLDYAVLSIFFKCSSAAVCRRIVLRTLDVLGDCLSSLIRWPREELLSCMPTDDNRNYGNIRCVVNRIEIEIRRSTKASVRVDTRSRYTRYHSVKFVTAVTPGGFVCIVSPAWGGRISHELAFERSNVVASLGQNDTIMIFKEFLVDDHCRSNNVQLVRSLFSKNNENLSSNEGSRANLNVNRKIRSFRIFRRKLSASLYRKADKMVTAICALENLRKSMMSETKASVS